MYICFVFFLLFETEGLLLDLLTTTLNCQILKLYCFDQFLLLSFINYIEIVLYADH